MTTNVLEHNPIPLSERIAWFGEGALRYSVVVVLAWIGLMKFTAYEAGAIEGLVATSPLLGWLYGIFSVQAVANAIGAVELATAIAIGLGYLHRTLAIVGAAVAVVTFSVTLSFIFTAPGWEATLGGFPALSVVPGQFLLKDLVLLAAAVLLLGKALARTPTRESS